MVDHTSIDEVNWSNISVFPNPATDIISLEGLDEITGLKGLKIISITGATVVRIYDDKKDIDVSELTKGIYFLNIIHEQGIETIRFVKQ